MDQLKILSNKLDQAPKNREAGYEARLQKMNNEIKEAFDSTVNFYGEQEIIDRFVKHQNLLPLEQIQNLNNGQSISMEIQREKKAKTDGRQVAIGPLVDPEKIPALRDKILSRAQEPAKAGNVCTYLIIKKMFPNPKFPENKDFELSMEQIEIPDKNALVMNGLVFHKKIKGDEVNRILEEKIL